MGDPAERAASATPFAPSFEAALERLEALVERLERGDLALEEALASFEEGVGLTRELGEQLASAERRVEQLVRDGVGRAVSLPLDPQTGLAARPPAEES